jgi:hypothetical protein
MTHLRREALRYRLHHLLPGSVTKVFKVRMGFNGYDANAIRCWSKSQLYEG